MKHFLLKAIFRHNNSKQGKLCSKFPINNTENSDTAFLCVDPSHWQ